MAESAGFGVSKDVAPFCVKDAPGRVPERGGGGAGGAVRRRRAQFPPALRFRHGGIASLPILRLAQLWQDLQQFRISLDKLGDVLDAPVEPARRSGHAALLASVLRLKLVS